MSIWSGIKGLFGGADKSGKAIELAGDSIRGIGNWIDSKDYTNQEKAKDWSLAVQAHIELVKATANENSIRSITRRWLAWIVAGYVMFWGNVAMVFAIRGDKVTVQAMIDVINALYIGVTFLAVMGFYFGVQLLRR